MPMEFKSELSCGDGLFARGLNLHGESICAKLSFGELLIERPWNGVIAGPRSQPNGQRRTASKWGSQSMENVAPSPNPRVKAPGVVMRTAFAAIALLQAMYNLQAHASDGPFDEFPFLVHCEVNGANHVFYLSKIGPDGVAVYVSHDRLAGTITIGGKAEPVGGSGAGSCSEKRLSSYDRQVKHMTCNTDLLRNAALIL